MTRSGGWLQSISSLEIINFSWIYKFFRKSTIVSPNLTKCFLKEIKLRVIFVMKNLLLLQILIILVQTVSLVSK